MKWRRDKNGQSLVEAIVAVGLFSTVIFIALTFAVSSYEATAAGKRLTLVQAYATETAEAARAVRDRGWRNLTYGQHGFTTSSGYWDLSGIEDTLEEGTIARSANVFRVYRDLAGNIVEYGGTLDSKTKKVITTVTSTIAGYPTAVYSIAAYFTNWILTEIVHTSDTDWAGGTHANTQVNGSGTAANISESYVTLGHQWVPGAGQSFIQTTVADFSAGTATGTAVTAGGSGDSGQVSLERYSQCGTGPSGGWMTITYPTFVHHINDLELWDPADGFAVGESGDVLRWNGNYWDFFDNPVAEALNGVDLLPSEADGFSVGAKGTIIRWNGSSWNQITSPTSQDLRGVSMLSATDGFAVGAKGTIIRWNGSAWGTVASSTNKELFGLHLITATDGFAVGKNGTILRWDGSVWSAFASPTGDDMRDVRLLNASEGYAVGGNGTMLKWNGTAWSALAPLTTHQLNAVFLLSACDGWITGNNGIRLWLGRAYKNSGLFYSSIIDSGASTTTWNSLSWGQNAASGTVITAAVRAGNTPTPGIGWKAWSTDYTNPDGNELLVPARRYLQYRLTLGTPSPFLSPYCEDVTLSVNKPVTVRLNGVSMISATDGFAVGASGQIARYNGTAWSSFTSPTVNNLNSVSMTSSTFGMAVGDAGRIINWNGVAWGISASPIANNLRSVTMLSSTFGLAVGANGRSVRWNGSNWTYINMGINRQFNGVSLASPTFGFAVGANGTIRRWNGSNWTAQTSPTNVALNGVSLLSATDGFAVGAGGMIIRWNGTSWGIVASPTAANLNSVHYFSATTGYAVGDSGTIVVWDGSSWKLDSKITSNALYGIDLVTDNEGWAVGAAGTFGHLIGVSGYMSSASYQSPVIDSLAAGTIWDSVAWSATTTPGTGITVATRTGETAIPDAGWSAYSIELNDPVNSEIISPAGRYLQYRATFTTTDPNQTALLDEITVSY